MAERASDRPGVRQELGALVPSQQRVYVATNVRVVRRLEPPEVRPQPAVRRLRWGLLAAVAGVVLVVLAAVVTAVVVVGLAVWGARYTLLGFVAIGCGVWIAVRRTGPPSSE